MTTRKVKIGDQPFLLVPLEPNKIITIATWEEGGVIKTSIRYSAPLSEPVAYGKLALDLESRGIRLGKQSCHLPPALFKLVSFMAENHNQLITIEQITMACGVANGKSSVSNLISRLKYVMRGTIWRCIRTSGVKATFSSCRKARTRHETQHRTPARGGRYSQARPHLLRWPISSDNYCGRPANRRMWPYHRTAPGLPAVARAEFPVSLVPSGAPRVCIAHGGRPFH